MNIGFDAKRAFYNTRGLGNYSRDTIRVLSTHQQENQYALFTPKTKGSIQFPLSSNCRIVEPRDGFYSRFPALWRSYGACRDIQEMQLDIFHGLSHELPFGVERTSARTVVTMHDVIFLKYPHLYPWIDRQLYKSKYLSSARVADKVVAISEQTKMDLLEFVGIGEAKIEVVYQGCNPSFLQKLEQAELDRIREKYNLPSHYILNVGAIEKRKNQELIIRALFLSRMDLSLILIGKPTEYLQELQKLVAKYHLESNVRFLTSVPGEDLPALYQMAGLFVYPSIFEGFGIPILEALNSGVPVITSKGGCFEETGGKGSVYVNHANVDELIDAIKSILGDTEKQKYMIETGRIHAQKFADEALSENLMSVYQSIL